MILLNGYLWVYLAAIIVKDSYASSGTLIEVRPEAPNKPLTLECHKSIYTFEARQTDANGKQCWDSLETVACWGRCDSREISDWRFPFKKSNHPVCMHYGRSKKTVVLQNCDEGVDPSTSLYEYLEADGCKCQVCSTMDTSCESIRYRPQRSQSAFELNMLK